MFKNASPPAVDLIEKLLAFDPNKRMTVIDVSVTPSSEATPMMDFRSAAFTASSPKFLLVHAMLVFLSRGPEAQ